MAAPRLRARPYSRRFTSAYMRLLGFTWHLSPLFDFQEDERGRGAGRDREGRWRGGEGKEEGREGDRDRDRDRGRKGGGRERGRERGREKGREGRTDGGRVKAREGGRVRE